MVGGLMKRQAGGAEHFVAGIAALGMGFARVSVTVTALRRGIVAARITGRVLDTGYFYHWTLHKTPEAAHFTCFRVNQKAGIIRAAPCHAGQEKAHQEGRESSTQSTSNARNHA